MSAPMKIYSFPLISYLILAVLAKNETSHDDLDILQSSISATDNVSVEKILQENSLNPINLTELELDRIRTENGNVCYANAIDESEDLALKYPFQTVVSRTDVSLNKSTVNKLERMVERYGGACTLAILRLHETRSPIASFELNYRSNENSTSLNEIFGTKKGIAWSEIGERIKLEYGDHCLLGLFRTIRAASELFDEKMKNENFTRHVDQINLQKFEIIYGTKCIAAITKLLRVQWDDEDQSVVEKNRVVPGRKDYPEEPSMSAKNDTFEVPKGFYERYGKFCSSLVSKLVKLTQPEHKTFLKKLFYRNSTKTRYLGGNDFEKLSSIYGRECLRASTDLLDIRVENKGQSEKKSYYVVPSLMRNDLTWPFYATRGQSKKMAFVHGGKCATGLYELGKRHPMDNDKLANVSITRRAYLRIDPIGYSQLKEKYGNDCSRALVTLLDIDVMNSTELRSTMREVVSDEKSPKDFPNNKNMTVFPLEHMEDLSTSENEITEMEDRKIEKRSTRVKRDENSVREKEELQRITLQFRKLDATKQEQICEYFENGRNRKVPIKQLRKILATSVTKSGEMSGAHFDHERHYQLATKNRHDREILILKWACEDRRPNQDKLYTNFGRSMSIIDPREDENGASMTEKSDVKFDLDVTSEPNRIENRRFLQAENDGRTRENDKPEGRENENYEIIDVDELRENYDDRKRIYYIVHQPYHVIIPYRSRARGL